MQPSSLIAIGFWYSEQEPHFPHPRALVGAGYGQRDLKRICEYLRSGKEFMGYLGYSSCRFGCRIPDSRMGSCDLTDGVWLWPEGLAHYVETHDVRLPEKFVEKALKSGWKLSFPIRVPPLTRRADGGADIPVSHEFWRKWVETEIGRVESTARLP